MRLVLDTNGLIAAFVARGTCHELVEHCQRQHTLVRCSALLDEFESKLIEKSTFGGMRPAKPDR